MGDTVFVGRLGAGPLAGSFRIDDHLPLGLRHVVARIGGDRLQRLLAAAAVDRHHPHLRHVPAEYRNVDQRALENVA